MCSPSRGSADDHAGLAVEVAVHARPAALRDVASNLAGAAGEAGLGSPLPDLAGAWELVVHPIIADEERR